RHSLPRSLRTFLRGHGATKVCGAGVLSYLLFEPEYCNELIELGYTGAMARREARVDFLGLSTLQPTQALAGSPSPTGLRARRFVGANSIRLAPSLQAVSELHLTKRPTTLM